MTASPNKFEDAAWLAQYVQAQVRNIFPVDDETRLPSIDETRQALATTLRQLRRIKAYASTGFSPLVSWQYAVFLYRLARVLRSTREDGESATLIFLLNKALNGIDLYHEIELSDSFVLGHTVGLVFAKATYGEDCVYHQNCTIGRNGDDRPSLGTGVILFPGSAVIGRCRIGSNTVVSAGVQLINRDTPSDCVVFRDEDGRIRMRDALEQYSLRYINPA
jgi:serine O-acetyltransferase